MIGNRILVVDDHAIVRKSLTALLSATTDLEVVAEAADGHEAIQKAQQFLPDIVLMDLTMPRTNGTEALRAIKQRSPQIKIIILTLHKTEEYIRATLQAGADGYVLKDDTQYDLMAAITSVQHGKIFLSPSISGKVIGGFLNRDKPGCDGSSWEVLTSREQEVLILIAEGKKNREIADCLSLSPKTVEKHRTNLMNKLDLHNVAMLTTYAIEHRLIALASAMTETEGRALAPLPPASCGTPLT